MDQKKYRPVAAEDKDYFIKEPTGGLYKKLKELSLRSSVIPYTSKLNIAKEFRLVKNFDDKEELKKFRENLVNEELNIEEYYESVFKILFMGAGDDVKFDGLNLNQMNQAISDFFTSASGS